MERRKRTKRSNNRAHPRPATAANKSSDGQKKRQDTANTEPPPSRVAKFFATYPSFDYNASNLSSLEFYRMCDHFGWKRHDPRWAKAHGDFKDALLSQFNLRVTKGPEVCPFFVRPPQRPIATATSQEMERRERSKRADNHSPPTSASANKPSNGPEVCPFFVRPPQRPIATATSQEMERRERSKRASNRSPPTSASANKPSNGPEEKRVDTTEHSSSRIAEFFAAYPSFDYDPSNSSSLEFYRMCDQFGWDKDHPRRVEAYQDFKDALVLQFNRVYGTDERKLENWQNLCHVVKIDPVPNGLRACQEAVRGVFINLVDLVDANNAEQVEAFETEVALSVYTKSTGKIFPRENAYAGGLLRYLLRHIEHPRTTDSKGQRARKRR